MTYLADFEYAYNKLKARISELEGEVSLKQKIIDSQNEELKRIKSSLEQSKKK